MCRRVSPLIRASGFKGDAPGQTVYVTLYGVTGKLFQQGVPAANFSAPQATGDSAKQEIVATGRVTFTSLKDKGTSIVADRVDVSKATDPTGQDGEVHLLDANGGQCGARAIHRDHVKSRKADVGGITVASYSVLMAAITTCRAS